MRTIITAHSGAENTVDNTLDSIRALVSCGAEFLEVDVCLQADKLVLTHNMPEDGAAYDTLEDCFAIVRKCDGICMNIDIKQPDIVGRVAELAETCGMRERILFSGDVLSADDFACAAEMGLTVWYNHTQIPQGKDLLQGAADAGFEVLNVNHRLVTDEMLTAGARRISAWTVNEPEQMERLLKAGVRNITTRRPALALQMRRKIQGEC